MIGKGRFGYKNDTEELVDICQFLRGTIPGVIVQREHYILFKRTTGKYARYARTFDGDPEYKIRNPDIMIIDRKTRKLVLCIEIDGSIHDVLIDDTWKRDEQYLIGGVPLLVINKTEIETNIYTLLNNKLMQRKEMKQYVQ